jgi:hypothetical protein
LIANQKSRILENPANKGLRQAAYTIYEMKEMEEMAEMEEMEG